MNVTLLSFVASPPESQDTGLLGWLSLAVGDLLVLDGVALRRTRGGELALAFPEPRDGRGRKRRPVRPVDDAARAAIEQQVFEALGVEGVL